MFKVNKWNYGQYSSSNCGVHTLGFTDNNGNDFYFSYETLVAFKHNGKLYVHFNDWGNTTGKHLNWIDAGNKKERLNDEEFKQKYAECFGV